MRFSKEQTRRRVLYLRGDIDVFVNRKSPIKDVHVAVHDEYRNRRGVSLGVGPCDGLAGVLNPIRMTLSQTLKCSW